jgi:predicted nucleic acid-binding protein
MMRASAMAGESYPQGLLDTNIVILRKWIDPADLPAAVAISAVTLAELSAGPHEVRPASEQQEYEYEEHAERARRLDVLQRAEHEFDPIPFGVEAARAYGQVTAAVISTGPKPRRRAVDLMIASVAIAEDLPLFTTHPADFAGLGHLLTVVAVTRPSAAPAHPLT